MGHNGRKDLLRSNYIQLEPSVNSANLRTNIRNMRTRCKGTVQLARTLQVMTQQKLSDTLHEPLMPFQGSGYYAGVSSSFLVRVLIHRRNLAC